MAITAQLVKQLRDITGAGMLDCKKALEQTDGDVEQAVTYLREKGIAKAAKKADRIAAEGLCNVIVDGNVAVVYEVNSETDFVAKNTQFLALIDKVGQALLTSGVTTTEEALAVIVEGKTIEIILSEATATIGEKITLRRVNRVEKKDDQVFGAYKHMGGRIASLSLLNGNNEEVAKDIAMHVAAQNPKFLDQTQISADMIASEKEILLHQALEENKSEAKPKPQNIIEKMVEGRLNKQLKEICLVNQPFVKNPDETVEQYVSRNKTAVVSFLRLEVGEGIEKKETDFAKEVAEQMKA
ncbi:Elongation factor Ts (EF-Ts) [Paracholeplasma brassicae]|uniref:Elongation factor Ts n=1 Tax=Acholeplasma brassicae TaxID=61635 RepID=U4KS61_9MOLU|nr:translation elongation factor Ts [Paracholeplasma brassicae]CCV66348.1 Elongation factor Ts (EF-Ts) [Paracholeplasma brassicae]